MFFTSPFTQPLPHAFSTSLDLFLNLRSSGTSRRTEVEQISVKKPTLNTFHKPPAKSQGEEHITRTAELYLRQRLMDGSLPKGVKLQRQKKSFIPLLGHHTELQLPQTAVPAPADRTPRLICSYRKGFGDTSYPDRTTMSCKVMQGPRLLLRINHLSARNSCLWPCVHYSLSVCFINQTLKYNKTTRQFPVKAWKINVSTS